MDLASINFMLDFIVHRLHIALPQGLITSVKGIFMKGTSLYTFMCIPLKLPFMAYLFLYIRNNKITSIDYSSDMEGFGFILKLMLFIVLGSYTHFQHLHNGYRV